MEEYKNILQKQILGGTFSMKKRTFNKYLTLANCFAIIPRVVDQFIQIPDFIICICMGACMPLYLISIYALNHDIVKLRTFKRNLISRSAK